MYKNQTQNVDIRISMFTFHLQQVEIFIVTFFLQISRLFAFHVANTGNLTIYWIKYLAFTAVGQHFVYSFSHELFIYEGCSIHTRKSVMLLLVINWITLHFHSL